MENGPHVDDLPTQMVILHSNRIATTTRGYLCHSGMPQWMIPNDSLRLAAIAICGVKNDGRSVAFLSG